jgi:hypothetical protein
MSEIVSQRIPSASRIRESREKVDMAFTSCNRTEEVGIDIVDWLRVVNLHFDIPNLIHSQHRKDLVSWVRRIQPFVEAHDPQEVHILSDVFGVVA